jgi:leucyl-tRNA synthetase
VSNEINLMTTYTPSAIEAAAQAAWRAADAYRVVEDPKKKKFYACSMLPYPSGKLHMGHVRNYTINDVMARFLRMKGYNVLMPMGWDAFGLPAENAAMKSKVATAKWTYDNIATMKAQCQALGLAIDWSRELTTCSPDYYQWNQWFFLKMLEKGIAYRKTQIVNWDPVDQTVLANEQVVDGRGWRSGAVVEKREIPGYYLNITNYSEELLDSTLNKLPGWSERLRLIQENWIGKSEGVRFAFTHAIKDGRGALVGDGKMYVFTTRADTIMGVTFVAVAAEHPIATVAAATNPQIAAFIEECKKGGVAEADMATMEKKGMRTGLAVTHPLTGESVDVWIGNYVLMSYGDGAVMGVPAHDERDFAFAKKYGLAIKQVVSVNDGAYSTDAWRESYGDKQTAVCVHSGKYDGLPYKAAVDAVATDLAAKGLGEKKTTFRLRDWGISRQRYWGTPIPVIHCESCGVVPVPEKDLPVVLPEDLVPDGSGNPLNKCASFLNVPCPKCGKPAKRETDTMDTFVDSAWYYMRYCTPGSETMVDARNDYWMPMDVYIGGIEHAVLHLLYARFWTKVMRDMDLLHFDEPFVRMVNHGMLLNHIFYKTNSKGTKDFIPPLEVKPTHDAAGHIVGGELIADGSAVEYGGVGKMGKTERNGVDPQELIDKYGADTARLFAMFVGGPEDASVWSDTGVEGSSRFLRRVWACATRNVEAIANAGAVNAATLSEPAKDTRREIHSVLKQVLYDYERMQYNTIVSGAMKMLNALEAFEPNVKTSDDHGVLREGLSLLLRMLYPITPHVTFELWKTLKFGDSVLDAPWPEVDVDALKQDNITLVLQINGKTRGEIVVPATADKAAIEAAGAAAPEVARYGEGRAPKKIIVVPGRLVNVVV